MQSRAKQVHAIGYGNGDRNHDQTIIDLAQEKRSDPSHAKAEK